MSALKALQDELSKGVENVEGWALAIKDKLPAAAQAAAQLEASPIAQAVLGKVLPPEVEAALATVINHFAAEAQPTTTDTAATTAPATTPAG